MDLNFLDFKHISHKKSRWPYVGQGATILHQESKDVDCGVIVWVLSVTVKLSLWASVLAFSHQSISNHIDTYHGPSNHYHVEETEVQFYISVLTKLNYKMQKIIRDPCAFQILIVQGNLITMKVFL
jgi:hypothetical protein